MKTAEEYIGNWKEVLSTNRRSSKITPVRMILVEHAINAINEARKGAIEECAKVATAQLIHEPGFGQLNSYVQVNKQSILDLIKELK